MSRPNVTISQEEFEKLCQIQCTKIEIAGWFRCSESTIERWCKRVYKESFDVVFDQKRQLGFISLRRVQFQEALKGNTTLLIWLGKQYLNQTDVEKSEVKNLKKDVEDIYEKIDVLQLVKSS